MKMSGLYVPFIWDRKRGGPSIWKQRTFGGKLVARETPPAQRPPSNARHNATKAGGTQTRRAKFRSAVVFA